MVIAGPYAAAMLAEMGARVIKIDATPEREQTISIGGMALIHLVGEGSVEPS
jgi:crotonobetainyl-CoA:carnitine CoA-transferase CaiB-like acyl-CoA transferase